MPNLLNLLDVEEKFPRSTDKLRGPGTVIKLANDGKIDDGQEARRRAHFQKLYDYYINDQKAIKFYTIRAMRVLFSDDTINQMLLPYMNIVNRVIKRICLAYKLPADRYVIVPNGEGLVPDAGAQKAHDNYQKLLNLSNINCKSKDWHRLARLLDTVYVQAVWRDDHLDYEIFPPHLLKIVENGDNYLEPDSVEYEVAYGDKIKKIYWSSDEYWVLDEKDRPIEGENDWGGVNRYGVIPLIPLRLKDTENHWGEGDTQLVDINEKINVLLASSYYNAILQAHGQLVGINTDIKGRQELGPDRIIQIKNVAGDAQADLKYIHPEPAIMECMEKIDWLLRTAAMLRGLPASSVSIDVKAESGAAKAIDNIELLETREDDLEYLRPFEKRLFQLSRTIWNYHAPSQDRIDEKYEFGIDFEQPTPPQTEVEQLKAKALKLEMGLWTPVDDEIDEDEGIDEDQAIEIVQKRLEVRNQLNDEFGILPNLKDAAQRTVTDAQPPNL